jgi:hypothetical protein
MTTGKQQIQRTEDKVEKPIHLWFGAQKRIETHKEPFGRQSHLVSVRCLIEDYIQ